ncbi:MAG: phosphoglycerate dehydrogenase [Armatimonadota bacterium]|nr:phosphoglycerate dehydrogenase [Armatimonadota bacterium]
MNRRARCLLSPDVGRASDEPLRLLRDAGVEVVFYPKAGRLTEADLLPLVGDADAIIAGTEPITARVLAAAPRLRIVARRGVGLDSVDVAAATARGVVVTTTRGVNTEAVADHAMALLLATARRVAWLDRRMKAGEWDRAISIDVYGKILGVVGFGAIGRAVARRAAGFGLRVLAYDVAPDEGAARALGVRLCALDELLAQSDFVSIHVPLLPDTRGLIGETTLARMKPGAILINTSRGPVVDEAALLRALQSGHLAGAGLDVFVEEPPVDWTLVQLDQVVATPHVASHTRETLARMDRACAEAVLAVLRGERPAHVANPEVYARAPE